MNSFSQRLKDAIAADEPKLRAISEDDAKGRPGGGEGWSRKQELGHLIDSAINNRLRFTRAALEGEFVGASYDGPGSVKLGGYGKMPWSTLIDGWKALNQLLGPLVDRIPRERLSAPCRFGDATAVSLGFIIDDYLLHMQHHLDHILSREHVTAYPGANLGF
jgi:hypothetical protein